MDQYIKKSDKSLKSAQFFKNKWKNNQSIEKTEKKHWVVHNWKIWSNNKLWTDIMKKMKKKHSVVYQSNEKSNKKLGHVSILKNLIKLHQPIEKQWIDDSRVNETILLVGQINFYVCAP